MRRVLCVIAGGIAALSIEAFGIARTQTGPPSLIARFRTKAVRTPVSYRARRRLDAENRRFHMSAWVAVATQFDAGSMTYLVTARGGSALIQNRVLLPALETERGLLRGAATPSTSRT